MRQLDVNVSFYLETKLCARHLPDDIENSLDGPLNDDLYTIGRMCAEFDVTPRTLRFYEAKELLFPKREGTRRLFTRACRARLRLILQGKRFGFSLEDIRQLLDLYAIGDQQVTQIARTYELGQERLRAMQAQRAELDGAIADLTKQLEWGEKVLAERGVSRSTG